MSMPTAEDISLRCRGFKCEGLTVPSFQLAVGQVAGLSIPAPFGESWIIFMQVLSGESRIPEVAVAQEGLSIIPQLESSRRVSNTSTLETIFARHADSKERLTAVCATHGMGLHVPYSDMPLTHKVLLELWNVQSCGASLLVLTTAGLDPLGIRAVHAELERSPDAVVHVFSSSQQKFYESSLRFSQVVECEYDE